MKYYIFSRRYDFKEECFGDIETIFQNYKNNIFINGRYMGSFNSYFKDSYLSNLKTIKFLINWAKYPDTLIEHNYDKPKLKVYE